MRILLPDCCEAAGRRRFHGTSFLLPHYCIMKKTTRKPLNRMTIFVISIFIVAAVIAAVYLVGFTPGEV